MLYGDSFSSDGIATYDAAGTTNCADRRAHRGFVNRSGRPASTVERGRSPSLEVWPTRARSTEPSMPTTPRV